MTRPTPLDPLGRLIADPAFWAAYLSGGDQDGASLDVPGEIVRFRLDWEYDLGLEMGNGLGYRSLHLFEPHDSTEVGYDDGGDPFEHVLRWVELDLTARMQTIYHPALPHPGPVLLLLGKFAPAFDEPDAAVAHPSLAAAAAFAGLTDGRWWERSFDARRAGVWWEQAAGGWVPAGDAASSTWGLYRTATDGVPARLATAFAAAEQAYRESVPAAWRTDRVRTLARAAVADLSVAPVLADALDDAGHDRPDLVANLRSGVPAQAGWVAEWLLGDCSGDAVRRACGPAPSPLAPGTEDDG